MKFILRANILFTLLTASVATATIIMVPQDQPTIQTGIDSALVGDTVLVDTGKYVENINFNGKSIVVGSLYLMIEDQGIVNSTIIDGNNDTTVVTLNSGETFTTELVGFTVMNGDAFMGGGIFIGSGASPVIRNNVITENHAGSCGGLGAGMAIADSSNPLIISNVFESNVADGICDCICYFGGGIWIDSTSNPVIGGSQGLGNIFDDNYADYGEELFREGSGKVINAQFNRFNVCPPTSFHMVYPEDAFDLANCSVISLSVEDSAEDVLPDHFDLYQNYPNPFNPITTLRYVVAERAEVTLTIHDILGRQVRTLVQSVEEPGFKSVMWDGTNDLGKQVSAGVYLYRIQAGEFVQTRKMILLR